MRSGLLYEVANRREESRLLAQDLAAREERIASLEFELREAQVKAGQSAAEAAAQQSRAEQCEAQLLEARQAQEALQQVRTPALP